MQVRYGPNVDEAQITPESGDLEYLQATMEAGYSLGSLVGAHDGESGFADEFLDVQSTARELVGYINVEMDEGVYIRLSTVFAAAMACAVEAEMRGSEEMQKASEFWCSIASEIRKQTDAAAIRRVTDPTNDVPSNPWEDE